MSKGNDKTKFFSIDISDDRMNVYLTVKPFVQDDVDINVSDVLQVLKSRYVTFGIKEDVIETTLNKVRQEYAPIEKVLIAEGRRPKEGRQVELELTGSCVKDREKVNALLMIKDEVYAYELDTIVGEEGEIYYKDSAVATVKNPAVPAVNGIDVFGKEVQANILSPAQEYKFRNHINYDEKEAIYVAVKDGVLISRDDMYEIFPININGKLEIEVSADKMHAKMNLYPADVKGTALRPEDVMNALNLNRVKYGIKDDIISNAVEEVNNTREAVNGVIVADGTPAINSEDGRIAFLVDVVKKISPRIKANGSVDFYNVSIIEGAAKDQPLARLIEPIPGKPGKDVFDRTIDPAPAKTCNLPMGDNTKVSDKDKNLLVSCIDGNVRYDGRVIFVKPGFTVDGDVDFGVGNISYKGFLVVKGDVKRGFKLDIKNDVEIGGTVEDATIMAEGNVLVKAGFVGIGIGIIEAKGDVTVGFVRNQTIIARNVTILKESVNASIHAKDTVRVQGRRLSIAGGQTTAGSKIEVETLGNEGWTPTEVEAGIDYTERKGLIKIRKEICDLKPIMEKVDKGNQEIDKTKDKGIKLSTKQMETHEMFLIQKEELHNKLKGFTDAEKILAKGLHLNKDARVMVHNIIYPSVTIRIGEATMTTQEEHRNATFYLSEGKIEKMK